MAVVQSFENVSSRPSLLLLNDIATAIRLTLRTCYPRLLKSWVYVPAGIFLILLSCWGMDSVLRLGISFPASVACMILLFLGLLSLEVLIGEKRTRNVVRIIDVPAGFALRYINVTFTPSFVVLPLSQKIGVTEVGKIAAVFLVGFVLALSATAYVVRGLQVLLGTSKRTIEESEAARNQGLDIQESIPLTHTPASPLATTPQSQEVASLGSPASPPAPPERMAEPTRVRGPGPEPTFANNISPTLSHPNSDLHIQHQPLPPPRAQKFATAITTHLDTITYLLLFLTSLPILYITTYTMPTYICLTVLTYNAALSFPPKLRKVLHPVLVCSALTILCIYLLALTQHQSLFTVLKAYSTKTRYLSLFRGQTSKLPPPGAGDLLASILDSSIVALAIPMYTYRSALRTHLIPIFLPCFSLAIASLTIYPLLCHSIGLPPPRSIAFAARSLTLALATPAVENLDGDLNLTAVLCIMSGIVGVLIGAPVLRFLRIPQGDYVSRGVSLGVNSSAVTTAELLKTDLRAAAMSSLAMVVFGGAVVALTAVPGVDALVRGLAGSS